MSLPPANHASQPATLNHRELVSATLTEQDTLTWLVSRGYIDATRHCPCANRLMRRVSKKGGEFFRCGKCRTEVFIFNNTIFKNSNIPINSFLDMIYFWSIDSLQVVTMHEVGSKSRTTIFSWYAKLRLACYEIMRRTTPRKIGGRGLIVEIDETKFSKRKYNVGRLVRSVWVIGGICLETKETFFVEVLSRSREVINSVILDHVHPGSVIFTDCWAGYNDIKNLGYYHFTVNHRRNFVNPENGVNTQQVENLWCMLKKNLRKRSLTNVKDFDLYFMEYCFKKKYSGCVFESFLQMSKNFIN